METCCYQRIKKLPRENTARILIAVEKLAKNPSQVKAKKLTNYQNTYRIRVGNYRVIYNMYHEYLVIEIIRIRHRKDVYRR